MTVHSATTQKAERASRLLRSLVGIVDLRTEWLASGRIRQLHVLQDGSVQDHQITRNAISALEAGLGVSVDLAAIKVYGDEAAFFAAVESIDADAAAQAETPADAADVLAAEIDPVDPADEIVAMDPLLFIGADVLGSVSSHLAAVRGSHAIGTTRLNGLFDDGGSAQATLLQDPPDDADDVVPVAPNGHANGARGANGAGRPNGKPAASATHAGNGSSIGNGGHGGGNGGNGVHTGNGHAPLKGVGTPAVASSEPASDAASAAGLPSAAPPAGGATLETIVVNRRGGMLRCRVAVAVNGCTYAAAADAPDSGTAEGEAELAARVTLDALRAGRLTSARLDGIEQTTVGGMAYLVAALREPTASVSRASAAPLVDGIARSAAHAVLAATGPSGNAGIYRAPGVVPAGSTSASRTI